MLSEARKLADQLSGKVGAVLMGAGVKDLAKEAVAYGADEVYVCDDEQLKNYRTDAYTRVLEDLVKGKEPGILLLPATTNGRDLAGRLAQPSGGGLAADCVALRLEDGQLVATPSHLRRQPDGRRGLQEGPRHVHHPSQLPEQGRPRPRPQR